MRLKIKRLDEAISLPEAATARSAAFDLASAVDIEIPPRSIRLVGTGLVIAVPDGYFLGIFARSSTPLKLGLMVANGVGVIDRTDNESEIWIPAGYIPDGLRPLLGLGRRLFPFLFRGDAVVIGPIPPGYPINLLANIDIIGPDDLTPKERAERKQTLLRTLKQAKDDLKNGRNAFTNPDTMEKFLSLSKCKDFVVNKGHYFGTNLQTEEPALSDNDKRSLIEFLKTF